VVLVLEEKRLERGLSLLVSLRVVCLDQIVEILVLIDDHSLRE